MEHITIIDNWRDLPLGVYLDILNIEKTETDELARQVAILSALTGLDGPAVLDLPLAEYKRLRAAAGFLTEPCPDDLLRVADRYPAGDFVLRPVPDYEGLTVAQYVDFQTFSRMGEQALPQLLSVLLIPNGRHYGDGYDMKAVQAAIRDWINVADALALAAHFFVSSSASIAATLDYSRALAGKMEPGPTRDRVQEKLKEVDRLLSRSAGDGSLQWMQSRSSAAAPGGRSGK